MFSNILTEKVIPIRLEFSVPKTQIRVQPVISQKFTALTAKIFQVSFNQLSHQISINYYFESISNNDSRIQKTF